MLCNNSDIVLRGLFFGFKEMRYGAKNDDNVSGHRMRHKKTNVLDSKSETRKVVGTKYRNSMQRVFKL